MPDERYVLLTGSKNNAGDYLIKHRAMALLREYRKDRSVIDYDGWKPLSDAQLEVVNSSKALVLMGGPALQFDMYPRIYPLRESLDDIRVPIICMGVGWKSHNGSWQNTHSYPLSDKTIELLSRVEASGHSSSVRDYRTLNSLMSLGYKNFMMTGCPALYSIEHLNRPFAPPKQVKQVSFSLGVSMFKNRAMDRQAKELIFSLRDLFCDANLTVVFHHSLSDEFLSVHAAQSSFLESNRKFAQWLDANEISYVDISGSAENLISHYAEADLHIGYRVHAHIFMNSISRPSVLITEDGRGKSLKEVIGGLILDGCNYREGSRLKRLLRRHLSGIVPVPVVKDTVLNLEYEMTHGYPRSAASRVVIDQNEQLMLGFIKQLP
ncbi:polysaccharide pyruvyl transferase family protein [Aestuariirhabdus sp. LZHN29]|uniref:polysaccharide pyruvyl transferase family protein n=1 Tax=Aestuariirhabdus sp. LZHN29 TaxID=3417462 RepID=UPI003CF91A29